ncbi:hypothetical protein FOA52_004150 [Chlamydomonas sp. UWO 241]|nr:hypothetical protein FOA52_004150 [Chlamydomonas sp. UWO 241]
MYLNPALVVASNLTSVELARDFWNSNGDALRADPGVFLSDAHIPAAFSAVTFLGRYSDQANFADLNSNILAASASDSAAGAFFPSMMEPVAYKGSNVFTMDIPGAADNRAITDRMLKAGERVLLQLTSVTSPRYDNISAVVTAVDEGVNEFTVAAGGASTLQLDQVCTLYGIRVHDLERLARINYLSLSASGSNLAVSGAEVDFNPELYRLLYPNANVTTNLDAVAHYLKNVGRIGKAGDLLSGGGSNVIAVIDGSSSNGAVRSLVVAEELVLDFAPEDGRLRWNNVDLFYATTEGTGRPVESLSASLHGIISERAIKQWVTDRLVPDLELEAVSVSGIASFALGIDVRALVGGDLRIEGATTFESNVAFLGDVGYGGSISVTSNLTSGRVGIGAAPTDLAPFLQPTANAASNAVADNIAVSETMYVGNNAQIDGRLYSAKGAYFKGAVQGVRIGVGPVEFTTYSDQALQDTGFIVSNNVSIPGLTACNVVAHDAVVRDAFVRDAMVVDGTLVAASATVDELLAPLNETIVAGLTAAASALAVPLDMASWYVFKDARVPVYQVLERIDANTLRVPTSYIASLLRPNDIVRLPGVVANFLVDAVDAAARTVAVVQPLPVDASLGSALLNVEAFLLIDRPRLDLNAVLAQLCALVAALASR